ncbi:Vascular endothelial growth factor A-A, partial [Anabarilius grahami]
SAHAGWASFGGQVSAVKPGATLPEVMVFPGSLQVMRHWVIPFLDVYKKSACKTRELLVDIIQEYPDEIEHTYIPSCVVLMRCAGCCNDEALECVPTETRNVTMEVLRVKQRVSQHNFQLSFTEHTKCECRPKAEVKAKKENLFALCNLTQSAFICTHIHTVGPKPAKTKATKGK